MYIAEPGEHAHKLYVELKSDFPEHLPVYTSMLSSLDLTEARRHVPHDDLPDTSLNYANQMLGVADKVLSAVDQDKLLAYFGAKSDQRPDAAKVKSTMEKQKNCLVEALVKKGCALSRLYVGRTKVEGEGPNKELLDNFWEVWKEVQKFAEPNDIKVRSSFYFII